MKKGSIKLGVSAPDLEIQLSDLGYSFDEKLVEKFESIRKMVQILYLDSYITKVRKDKIMLDLENRILNHIIRRNHGKR